MGASLIQVDAPRFLFVAISIKGFNRVSNQTILVVDDDAMNREVMEAFLSSEGYEILLANTGKLALQLVSDNLPDLIILDVKMPDMNGYDVCTHLKQDDTTRHIPIMIVTGFDSDEDRQAAQSAGADRFLSRPFSGNELIDQVKSTLNA